MKHPIFTSQTEDQALKHSILKTLRFFDQFQFPLTPQELASYLYKPPHEVPIKTLKGFLEIMEEEGEIEQLKGHVILKGRAEGIERRKARYFVSERLWHRAKLYTQYLHKIPFLRMVAVCNNLAYNNAREDSDIDLLIVIEKGRMWLTRAIVTLTLQFFGVRRHGKKTIGRFCLSFFVTPAKLNMGEIALKGEDPYLAYWVKTLSPLYGAQMYEEFKQANEDFLKPYGLKFSDQSLQHLYKAPKESLFKRVMEFIFKGFLGNLLEFGLKKTYKKKTLRRMSELDERANVVVSDDMLKFHNHDKREEFRKKMA